MHAPGSLDELHALAPRYADRADAADGPGLAALFTPDGQIVIDGDPAGPAPGRRVLAGHDAIVAAIDGLAAYDTTFHSVIQRTVAVTDAGDRAQGQTYCTAHHLLTVDGQRWDRVLLIRYADEYARASTGWRFTARTLEVRAEMHVPVHPSPTGDASA